MKVTIRTADWSDPGDRRHLEEAAGLIYESFTEFYNLVSPSQEGIRRTVIDQLEDVNSELGYSLIATLEESLGGISVYYPSEEIKARQLISLRHLMRVADPRPDIVELLKTFRMKVEPLSMPRYMNWARLGVAKQFRRLGVASLINAAMEYDCRVRRYEYIGSHLNRQNTPSMKMHVGRGFARVTEGDFEFVAMVKALS